MAKFVELNDAARLLNVTPEELKEMRQRGDIAGVSTGAGWKFKQDEIDRVLAERADDSSSSSMFSDEFDHLIPEPSLDDDPSGDQDSASILVSDEVLGKSAETTSSTIIGKNRPSNDALAAESDIKLASESLLGGASEIGLMPVDSSVFSGKESQLNKSGSGTGDLTPDASFASALGADSLALNDDALALGDDDDDMVLGGSDVTRHPTGSGINLINPHDSGVSLEEPLELGGSQIDSLELPEDSDMISLGEPMADPERATQLKADEEFMLSPMADDFSDESSDSGSQVIALADSEQFDEGAATMLGGAAGGFEQPLLTEDSGDTVGQQLGGFGGPGVTATMSAPATQYVPVPMPDVPYSVWNVLGLLCVFMILMVSGMLMVDLLRNMWAFDSNTSATTAVMDGIISALRLQ